MSVFIKSVAQDVARREALVGGLGAILLGILFLGVTGLAHPQAIHDGAHDTRHAMNFPCH